MNSLRLAFFIIVVFILDQVLLGFSGSLILNLSIPTVVFLSSRGKLPRSLVVAFSLGFMSDTVALRAFPIMAIYLLVISMLVDYVSNRHIEFKSVLAMFILTVALYVVQIVLLSTLYAGTLTVVSLYSVIVDSLIGILMIIALRSIFRNEAIGK